MHQLAKQVNNGLSYRKKTHCQQKPDDLRNRRTAVQPPFRAAYKPFIPLDSMDLTSRGWGGVMIRPNM